MEIITTDFQESSCQQQVADQDATNSAVYVRNAQKSYGIGKRRSNILQSLDMTVTKGTIYGLLGASGCGKTTLLSCIVGRRSLDSGEVYVFGGEPGTKESGIPGRRVGYMPQELALYGEFNIKETLVYFGRLYRLPSAYVKSQMEFLFKLLDLPPGHRYIKSLSGGQQRRVSFAVALFHDPELLILDEPTVGLDPLLRKEIWNHLTQLSNARSRTIIITTHYIEEARQSHTIGMMRSGRLLTEDSPQNLLVIYNMSSLEDVFLKLCVKSETDDLVISRATTIKEGGKKSKKFYPQFFGLNNSKKEIMFEDQEPQLLSCKLPSTRPDLAKISDADEGIVVQSLTSSSEKCQSIKSSSSKRSSGVFNLSPPSLNRIVTLTHKNLVQIFRNIGLLLFNFVLPALMISMFCLAIGHDPTSLKMAIVNDELAQGSACHYDNTCTYSMLGCRYLRFLNNETISQVDYSNYSDAIEAMQNGYLNGVVHFAENFTDDLKLKESQNSNVNLTTIIGSQIHVQLDWSNHQVARMLQRRLLEAFEDFRKDFLTSCSQEETAADIPVTFLDPVYGSKKTPFTVSMTPGVCVSMVYIMAVALTAILFVSDRKRGLLDRIMVTGVQTAEILFAHLISQFVVLLGQTGIIFLMVIFAFHIPVVGSLPLAFFLCLMQGLCGMCIGLLISTSCSEEITALQMSMGLFYPNILLSGVLWPIDGIWPVFLRKVVYFLPQTYAIESMNGIFARGWGMEHPQIYFGFLITFAWIFGLLALSLLVLRIRKYTG